MHAADCKSLSKNPPKVFRQSRRGAAKLLSVLLALALWQGAAMALHNPLLLVGPVEAAGKLLSLAGERESWHALWVSLSGITRGFLMGFGLALVLAVLAARLPLAEILLAPYMTAVKTVPVASFIVIALLWLSGRRLGTFISFLMVLPVLYTNFLEGLRSADGKLEEMAQVFHMSLWNRIRCIYAPALRPYCLSACRAALGLCWKAGVAAEVIGVSGGSMGGMLYDAKVYLELDALFAWTAAIVMASIAFEWCFLRLIDGVFRWIEGK